MQAALKRYEEFKKILDNAKESSAAEINAAKVKNVMDKLFKLEHCGLIIKRLFEGQSSAYEKETENSEFVYENGVNLTSELPTQQNTSQNHNRKQFKKPQRNTENNQQNQSKNNNFRKGQRQKQSHFQGNQQNPNYTVPPQYQSQPYFQQPQQPQPAFWPNIPPPLFQQNQPGPPPNYNQNYWHGPTGNYPTWPNQIGQSYQNQQQQCTPPPNEQSNQQQYNNGSQPYGGRNNYNNNPGIFIKFIIMLRNFNFSFRFLFVTYKRYSLFISSSL